MKTWDAKRIEKAIIETYIKGYYPYKSVIAIKSNYEELENIKSVIKNGYEIIEDEINKAYYIIIPCKDFINAIEERKYIGNKCLRKTYLYQNGNCMA